MSHDSRETIYLASTSPVKRESILNIYKNVICVDAQSGVSEQPLGFTEIRTGALNRLNCISGFYPAIAHETGIIYDEEKAIDATCSILRTNIGMFEKWSYYKIKSEKFKEWILNPTGTFGKFAFPKCHDDWYRADGDFFGRSYSLRESTISLQQEYEAKLRTFPMLVIPAPLLPFKQVPFLDIQYPLIHHSRVLTETVEKLSHNLLFNKVVGLDARGFLFASIFTNNNVPFVMARKPGKLPSEEYIVEYVKEYGSDKLSIEKSSISKGDKVLVVDDLIATGGTMKAVERLVRMAGAEVVCFIAPFAIARENGELLCDRSILQKCRFLCTQIQASKAMISFTAVSYKKYSYIDPIVYPPSLLGYDKDNTSIPVSWGRFAKSSNIWFNSCFEGEDVLVFMDPSNAQESFDVLQLLSILYRKNPKSVKVVIPFLEQGTQDRIEYKEDGSKWESLACVDTIGKLLGNHEVLTFDLHSEQSQFAFYNLKFKNLVRKLWQKYSEVNKAIPVFPDEGASKRYGIFCKNHITFRKIRDQDKRRVFTDSQIKNERYVIIDDMVRSGGTMNEVGKYLLERGAKSVDALFTHAPLESSASKNMEIFTEIWSTNTCINSVPRSWVKLDITEHVIF